MAALVVFGFRGASDLHACDALPWSTYLCLHLLACCRHGLRCASGLPHRPGSCQHDCNRLFTTFGKQHAKRYTCAARLVGWDEKTLVQNGLDWEGHSAVDARC